MTDEELSRILTEAMDARIQRAEQSSGENSSDFVPGAENKSDRGEAAAPGHETVVLKPIPARTMLLRAALAAVLVLVLLGGGALLFRLMGRTEPPKPELTDPPDTETVGESTIPTETGEPEPDCPNQICYYVNEFLTMDIRGEPSLYAMRGANERGTLAMLIDDYDVMTTDAQGRFVVNDSVCESMETEENDDGSRTVTVKLREGLRYSDGTPITAVDFLVNALLDFSPQMAASSYDFNQNVACFAGADAYLRGETDTISGLRLIDEHSYSVTVPPEAARDFFLCARISLRPVSAAQFGAEAVVEGETVRLRYSSPEGPDLERGRGTVEGRVSAGPYVIEKYDAEADRVELRINEYYAGNFEGQKPTVETLVLEHFGYERDVASVLGEAPVYFQKIIDADMIQSYLEVVEAGKLKAAPYLRGGYGYLLFQCDMGPTQFRAVRQAIACLIDRDRFADEFCQGYGEITHGPYVESGWTYQAHAEELDRELDPYACDPARAAALLEADGWVLAEDGTPYVSGLRWKEVTPEQAGSYPYNVRLADGRILMPLLIDRMRAASGASTSDLLDLYTAENPAMIDAGIRVQSAEVPFDQLLDCLYRVDWTAGDDCTWYYDSGETRTGPNSFCLANLAASCTPLQDYSTYFIEEYSVFHYDCDSDLARLSRQMREAPNDDAYAALWKDFILEWNRELPCLPLYQNSYYDFMDPRIQGLEPDTYWPFARAVLYATVG